MSAAIDNEVTEAAARFCEDKLQALMDDNQGIIFSMVATVDGFDVAAKASPGWDIPASRLAAMASSGHALGDTVASEIAGAECDDVIIDADRLSIVFLAVPGAHAPPLILGVAATKSSSLGNVLVDARGCARTIGEGVLDAA